MRARGLRLLLPILIFGAAELSARACDVRTKLGLAERRSMAAYAGKPWADQYFKDSLNCVRQSREKAQPRYARYVLQTINEDCTTPTLNYHHRLRVTWNPPDASMRAATRVIDIGMFGGSTMEGLGAIDDETIPSQLSRRLNAAAPTGTVYRVTNYGVSAYTYTQSVMRLVTLLRAGAHFDVVVFYDGANDTDYAYEHGEAGALDGEDVVETRTEGSVLARAALAVKDQLNDCVLCMAAGIALRHTPFLSTHVSPLIVRARDAIHFKRGAANGVGALGQQIADYYAGTHAMVDKLAAAYGFARVEFWQPSLMYDAGYGPGEAPLAHMDPRLTDQTLRALYADARAQTLAKSLADLHDLSHALDGRTSAYYLDAVHISGDGNGVVADAMRPFLPH